MTFLYCVIFNFNMFIFKRKAYSGFCLPEWLLLISWRLKDVKDIKLQALGFHSNNSFPYRVLTMIQIQIVRHGHFQPCRPELICLSFFSCSNSQEVEWFLWLTLQLCMKLIRTFASPLCHFVSIPKCIANCMCNAVRDWFERFMLVSKQSCFDTNGSRFRYTSKVDSTQTEINSIQTEVIWFS